MFQKIERFILEMEIGEMNFSANRLKFVPTAFEYVEPLYNIYRLSKPSCWLFSMEIRSGTTHFNEPFPITRGLSDIILTQKERPTYADALLTYAVISAKLELLPNTKWIASYQSISLGYENANLLLLIADKIRHKFNITIGTPNYQQLLNYIESELKDDHNQLFHA